MCQAGLQEPEPPLLAVNILFLRDPKYTVQYKYEYMTMTMNISRGRGRSRRQGGRNLSGAGNLKNGRLRQPWTVKLNLLLVTVTGNSYSNIPVPV